jgi:hypothetical protein
LGGGNVHDDGTNSVLVQVDVHVRLGRGNAVAMPRRLLMLRNTVRGVLGLVFVAAATWLANYVTELMFGPENPNTSG